MATASSSISIVQLKQEKKSLKEMKQQLIANIAKQKEAVRAIQNCQLHSLCYTLQFGWLLKLNHGLFKSPPDKNFNQLYLYLQPTNQPHAGNQSGEK